MLQQNTIFSNKQEAHVRTLFALGVPMQVIADCMHMLQDEVLLCVKKRGVRHISDDTTPQDLLALYVRINHKQGHTAFGALPAECVANMCKVCERDESVRTLMSWIEVSICMYQASYRLRMSDHVEPWQKMFFNDVLLPGRLLETVDDVRQHVFRSLIEGISFLKKDQFQKCWMYSRVVYILYSCLVCLLLRELRSVSGQ